jgi:hypothetical protein
MEYGFETPQGMTVGKDRIAQSLAVDMIFGKRLRKGRSDRFDGCPAPAQQTMDLRIGIVNRHT